LKKKLGGRTRRFFLLDRYQYIVYRGVIICKEETLIERVERPGSDYPRIQPAGKAKKPTDRPKGDTRGRKKPRRGSQLDVEA